MKPEIKKLWIEALNSGKYQQGRTFLHKGDKFCCLGVLCELYCKKVSNIRKLRKETNIRKLHTETKYSYAGRSSNLPDVVSIWAGIEIETTIPTGIGRYSDEGSFTSLSFLNDSGTPFKEIAEVIDKHF